MFAIRKSLLSIIPRSKVVPFGQTKRGILFYINNDATIQEPKHIALQWNQAILDAEGHGSDPFPHFRRFYMKPKETRKMRVNKRKGRMAYSKVKDVADLVEFKRTLKFA